MGCRPPPGGRPTPEATEPSLPDRPVRLHPSRRHSMQPLDVNACERVFLLWRCSELVFADHVFELLVEAGIADGELVHVAPSIESCRVQHNGERVPLDRARRVVASDPDGFQKAAELAFEKLGPFARRSDHDRSEKRTGARRAARGDRTRRDQRGARRQDPAART